MSYWIHGRNLPGYPASHGCIGLYDEPMQLEQYKLPKDPELNDAKRLFDWVLGGETEDEQIIPLKHGPPRAHHRPGAEERKIDPPKVSERRLHLTVRLSLLGIGLKARNPPCLPPE